MENQTYEKALRNAKDYIRESGHNGYDAFVITAVIGITFEKPKEVVFDDLMELS